MALNGAKINCWAQHERSLPKKVRRAAKRTNAPPGRWLHWQQLGKVMLMIGRLPVSFREFQVLLYFLAETSRLKI